MEYKLEDLIDIPLFQSLQDKLNEIYSFPSAIIDLDGKILTATAWQDVCTKFHRINPESEKECIKSDRYIADHLHEANPAVTYRCPHGLVDNATPIIVDGKHLGNFFTGQFFLEKPDIAFFNEQIKKFDFDEQAYLDAVSKVPVWSEEQLNLYLSVIKAFTEILAGIGYKNLEEKRARKRIEVQEQQYKVLLESSIDGFLEFDSMGRFVDVNNSYCQLTGYTREELLTMSLTDVDPQLSFTTLPDFIQALTSDRSKKFESKHRCKDGRIIYFENSINYIDEDNKFFLFLHDITRHIHAEESLKESKALIDVVSDNIPAYIALVDAVTLEYKYVNQSFVKGFGKDKNEIEGYHISRLIGKENYEFALPYIQTVLQGDSVSYINTFNLAQGKRYINVSYSPQFGTDGRVTDILVMSSDITESKLAEDSLLQSREAYKRVVNNVDEIIYSASFSEDYSNITIDFVSERVRKILGYAPEDFTGSPNLWKSVIHPDDLDEIGRKRFKARIYRMKHKHTGEYIWIEDHPQMIRDDSGKIIGQYSTARDITETRKFQEKLLESSERLNRAEIASKSGNWELHIGSDTMIGSKGAAAIYGIEREELKLEHIRNVPLPEYRSVLDKALENLLEKDEPYNVEFKIRALDTGEIKDIHSGATFDRENRILFGVIQDITDRKQTEESLHEIYTLNNSLLNTIPFGMDIVDESGNILFVSENMKKLVVGDVIGEKCWNLYREDQTQCSNCPLHKGIQIGSTGIYETSGGHGGRIFQISHTGMMFQGKKAMLEIFQDITEKKEIEKRVKLLAHSLESISECVSVTDTEDRIFYVNDSFLKTYGYSEDELIGKTIDIVRPAELEHLQVRNILPKSREGGWRGELINKRKDGSLFPILLSSSAIKDENGNLVALVGVAIDITDMQKARKELMDAKDRAEENNRLRAALLNNMSHEIRTPMNAIMGFTDLMKEADVNDKDGYAEIINKSANQLLALIEDVILLSRLQSEKMPLLISEFYPAELVTEIRKMFNHPNMNKGLEIKEVIPEDHRYLKGWADAKKIRQVITNFLSNALKYTLEGSLEIGFNVEGDMIEFFVKDTGIGIPEAEQQLIFEPFYRGEHAVSSAIRGTGLGLNIAKGLVNLLGGEIGVESEISKGSRFYFAIPFVSSEMAETMKVPAEPKLGELKTMKILIAEDDPFNFQFLEIILKGVVAKVDLAVNGKEAIEMASRNGYNLIFMDLKMPLLDGIEATKILRRQFPKLPIIAQTACTLPEEREIAIKAGCNDLIFKPINKEKVMEMIIKYG